MKAIVFERYGSPEVLKVVEIEKPIPNKKRGPLMKAISFSSFLISIPNSWIHYPV